MNLMVLFMFSLTIGGLCQDSDPTDAPADTNTDPERGDGDPLVTATPADDSQTPIEMSAPTDLPLVGE